jgi:type IV pilus assembly protein PilE
MLNNVLHIMKNRKKFSLLELLIAIAILGMLATIGLRNYSSYLKRSRRTDAINTLLGMSLAEERYRSNHSQYGTLAQVWGGVTTSSDGYYTLRIRNVSATHYTLTAMAQGAQANDSIDGTSCTTLTLSVANNVVTKSPSVCWPT